MSGEKGKVQSDVVKPGKDHHIPWCAASGFSIWKLV